MLTLRFKLQKNQTSKSSEERKKYKKNLHTCALEHAFVQNIKKNTKTHSKSKKPQKNIFLFLNQFQL